MQDKFKVKGIQSRSRRTDNSPKKKDKRTNNATAQRKWIKGQTIQEPKEKVQKDKQYNSPKKKDKRTNNTTAQRKRTKGQTIQQPKEKGQKD